MISCFHESVLPAAHVSLFGISPCLEASEKDQDEVEGATTEALPGSLFLLVRASQFCVAPAGQTKLRSGGLREGWLTHVGGCAPCCRPRTRPWRRRFAISLAQVVLAFRCGWSRELLTNSDELEGLLIQAASAQTTDPKAVRPGVLLVCASAFGSADCGPRTSSCRRRFRRKRRSRRCSGSNTVVCLMWIDAGSTSQSRYFLKFVA